MTVTKSYSFTGRSSRDAAIAAAAAADPTALIAALNSVGVETRNKEGNTLLHIAASSHGATRCVEVLIDRRAGLDVMNANNYTPLMCACMSGSADSVRALLDAGANVTMQDLRQSSALHYAASRADCLRLLLAHHADANAKREDLYTPLHAAARSGSAECIELLIRHGAMTNAVEYERGWTALHIAAQAGNVDAASALLNLGASRTIRDNDGLTPYELSQACGAAIPAELAESAVTETSGQNDQTVWLMNLERARDEAERRAWAAEARVDQLSEQVAMLQEENRKLLAALDDARYMLSRNGMQPEI